MRSKGILREASENALPPNGAERKRTMEFHAKDFAGTHCGCRYQQDYRPTLGRDGKKESGTL